MDNTTKTIRKSICFVTDIFTIGGVESVLLDALKHLSDYDIDIISLYYEPDKSILEKLPPSVNFINLRIPVTKFNMLLSGTAYLSGLYFNKIIKKKYDYLVALKPDTMNLCFSKRGKETIYWCHNDYHVKYSNRTNLSFFEKLKRKMLKLTYKKHDQIWTVSQTIADGLKSAFSINNAYALPNPIDCRKIIEKSNETCDITFDKSKNNFVLIGRLAQEKGVERVINAFNNQNVKNSQSHLYIIGDGGERKKLESKVAEYGLSNMVSFLGAKSNPFPYLKQASMFISPSYIESFGLSIMEAMLLEIPVITTATTGGTYVTQNGTLGRCVKNDDAELSKAIVESSINASSYNYPLDKAKQWVLNHNVDKFGETLKNLLNKN